MERILYIGQYSKGTTSRMRADELSKIINANNFDVIDTNIPFYKTLRVYRTIGFRFKLGPLIWQINKYIKNNLNNTCYDLIWIDKAIFLQEETIKIIRDKTDKLVHYTPDMAFYANKSIMFENSLKFYDKIITTKSTEVERYLELIPKRKLVITTQGFSKDIHKLYHKFNEKDNSVVFIGLGEPSRFEIASFLINNGVNVKLVGKGWRKFVNNNRENKYLNFISEGVFGEDYSKLISSSKFALGLLSKNFPELHTTRTFEIPACGTALITEKNIETNKFFDDTEVIFYNSKNEMLEKIQHYSKSDKSLSNLIRKGNLKVNTGGNDYKTILNKIIKTIDL